MDKKAFGIFLRKRRQAVVGKTLEECALELKLSPVTLRRWEQGLYAPRVAHYRSIGEVYGLTHSEILTYTGVDLGDTVAVTESEDRDLLPLIKKIATANVPRIDQRSLNGLIRAFCKCGGVDFDANTIEVLVRFQD